VGAAATDRVGAAAPDRVGAAATDRVGAAATEENIGGREGRSRWVEWGKSGARVSIGVWIPRRKQGRRMVCLDGSDDLKADPWEAYPGLVISWREGSIKMYHFLIT
jgi:hypothetical protein